MSFRWWLRPHAPDCRMATCMVLSCAVMACTSGQDDDGSPSDQSAIVTCPTEDAAQKTALAKIASVAATCGDVPPPAHGPIRPFRGYWPSAISYTPAFHRGRDSFYAPPEAQWVLGKFAYGFDFDLVGEDVDIWLLRGCSGTWEKLGTAVTTEEG